MERSTEDSRFNLESSVGQGGECVCGGAGQGATTRNSGSISRSCNAAMRRRKRAIRPVAWLTQRVKHSIEAKRLKYNCSNYRMERSTEDSRFNSLQPHFGAPCG